MKEKTTELHIEWERERVGKKGQLCESIEELGNVMSSQRSTRRTERGKTAREDLCGSVREKEIWQTVVWMREL